MSKKEFTWREKGHKIQCRLDYFLTTPNLTKLTRNCDIIHAPGSDHCAVKLFIQSEALNKKPGPGFWKFNSSLLENEAYINELKENIKAYRNKYDYLEDKGLKWDLLKIEMRSFTIAYTKKKPEKEKTEKILQEQLNNLLAQSEHCKNYPALRIKIQTVQSRLKRITEQKVKGAMMRSKAGWTEYGEKKIRDTFLIWKNEKRKRKGL